MNDTVDESAFYPPRSCRGKVKHRSRRHAFGVLRVMVNQGRLLHPETMNAYRCHTCKKWHLGNR